VRSTVKPTDTARSTSTYEAGPEQSLSEAVLEAVAEGSGIDQLELADEFGPLYDAIDPTALDSLFQPSRTAERPSGTVSFDYAGYRITVDESGTVTLSS
jgi:hypothetical protein